MGAIKSAYSLPGSGAALLELAPSADGHWRNLLVVVARKGKAAAYKLGWSVKDGRWADTNELGRIYAECKDRTAVMLSECESVIARGCALPIPVDSHMYQDDLLESVAAVVARESMPAVSAVIAVAGDDKAARMRVSRRLNSRLPYTSKCGILERIQVKSAPAGWVGRPPKWWLVVTPVGAEAEACDVATDAKKTAEQREIEERRAELIKEDRERAERQAERDAEIEKTWLLSSEWYVKNDRVPSGFKLHPSVKARLEAEKQAQSNIPSDDDLPW